MKRRTGNQYTGANSITQREADTINRCMVKVMKIASRENLAILEVRDLNDAYLAMRDALK